MSVGGGSPLDVGKLIAFKTTHERPLHEYDDAIGGDAHITSNVPPIITIPTTAGTGSEVGRSGVVTLEATGRKTVIFSPYFMAKGSHPRSRAHRLDAPARHRGDRFRRAHALPRVVLLARRPPHGRRDRARRPRALRKSLARAVENGSDLEARGDMMKAAMMGAVAFQKGLGACHSLAHPLSSEKHLHHGLSNALCLPAVVEFNDDADPREARTHPRHPLARGQDTRRRAPRDSRAHRPPRRAARRRGHRVRHSQALRESIRGRMSPFQSEARDEERPRQAVRGIAMKRTSRIAAAAAAFAVSSMASFAAPTNAQAQGGAGPVAGAAGGMNLDLGTLLKAKTGAWADYSMSGKGADKSLTIRYSLVGRTATTLALEIDSATPKGEMVIHFDFAPQGADAWKVVGGKMQLGELKQDLPADQLASTPPLKTSDSPGNLVGTEDLTTPVGAFSCKHYKKAMMGGANAPSVDVLDQRQGFPYRAREVNARRDGRSDDAPRDRDGGSV